MPDGRSGDYSGIVQGGSNADNALADAYVKGLPGINWTDAYQAMLKDAEVAPYNTFNPTDLTNGIQFGRGALSDWVHLGYLSDDGSTRSISRSIEYSLNDFSLYQIAKEVAPGDADKYLNRSAQWQNQWSHNVTHKGFTGFMAPRSSNGQFNLTDYNPAKCGDCSWSAITYEGTPFGSFKAHVIRRSTVLIRKQSTRSRCPMTWKPSLTSWVAKTNLRGVSIISSSPTRARKTLGLTARG